MRRLYRALTQRMVVKIFVPTAAVVGGALVFLALLQSQAEVRRLERSTREAASQIADLVVGSIEHAMLQGDGITVKQLVAGFKRKVPDANIQIFDRRGIEVFGAPSDAAPPPPAPGLSLALSTGARQLGDDGHVYRPLPNEERCHECHDPEAPLRGVLAFTRDEKLLRDEREDLAAELVRAGFVHIMTARQSGRLDDYFAELSARAPTLVAVGVYDREGDLAFGKDVPGLTPEIIQAALQPGAARSRIAAAGMGVQLIPLPREERCSQCHKDKGAVRGLLAVALAEVPEGSRVAEQELEVVVDSSLRAIMMSSLGRIIADYLWEVAGTGAVKDLKLYDAKGRAWFDSVVPPPGETVARALANPDMPPVLQGSGKGERVLIARQLKNEGKCTTCHGSDHPVRGVVTVSLPNDKGLMARQSAISRTVVFAAGAWIAVALLFYGLMRFLLGRPVKDIGAAAAAVGEGNLRVEVKSANPDGDEMQRLGTRINKMILDLRTKFELQKQVSRGAVKLAETAARRVTNAQAIKGVRRHLVVMFSDIRGFTAYSETVAPEEVVDMLNTFLQAQAEVVEKWGGDIDKFVGDELMATFEGDDAARRAVRCGIEMLEAVQKARKPEQNLAVGVGISSGDMVYGPIGAMNRFDTTVIGDVVNTGARLCSNAEGGQVLVSRAVVDDCKGGLGDIEFNALPPLKVKNKREPLEVYSVSRIK